ncbi:MAG TPA: hypothetical protein PKE31_18835 [Pseudomonadota bacterium]|jgi:hypothetical protein|nr:hypothetical protein [Pseudomonadota bacterium]
MSIKLDEEESPFDEDSRRLCADPACIGVMGEDGRCTECGRQDEGAEPQVQRARKQDHPDPADARSGAASLSEPSEASGADPVSDSGLSVDGDFEARTLCEDPSCIGVLSQEGRCSECGRTFPRNTATQ